MDSTPLLLRRQEHLRSVPPRSLDFYTRIVDIFDGSPSGIEASRPKVLVVTRTSDTEADAVGLRLAARGIPYLRVDCDTLVHRAKMSLRIDQEDDGLSIGSGPLRLDDLRLVWFRHFDAPAIAHPVEDPRIRLFVRSEWDAALRGLRALGRGHWVNDPRIVHAMDRLHQLRLAREVLLSIPKTLVSNDPDEIRPFVERRGGEVVVKAVGDHFVETAPTELHGVFPQVSTLSELSSKEALTGAPSIYQERIGNAKEIRVTAMGEEMIAVEVTKANPAEIWQDPDRVSVEIHELPTRVGEKLLAFMRLAGLRYGAFDLLLTPGGEYVFLEVNPEGDWTWLESRNDGLGITGAFTSYVLGVLGEDS